MDFVADRQIIGWSLAASMQAEATTIPAFKATRRTPGEDLISHSDRGSQYTAADFTELLDGTDITQSMSRRGNCWDNAPAESFFKTLKAEIPVDLKA